MPARSLSLIAVIALCASGCGGAVQPVHGKVVFADGTPATELAGYYITLQSTDQKGASGVIKPDASFTIGSLTESDGAEIGKHRVAITRPADELRKPKIKRWIDERYANFDTSNLEIEVKRGVNTPTITVEKLKAN